MTKHYSTDNECLLTGGLWALLAALIIGGLSAVFFDLWPTAVIIFVIVFLIGFAVAAAMCKTRTVGRGGLDLRAIDLARAEMGMAPHTDLPAEPKLAPAAKAKTEAKPKPKPAAKPKKAAKPEPEPVAEAPVEAETEAKPELLKKARGGKADDLKLLKGIGPKLEKELNAAGVYHFDQIAGWNAEQVAWADQHLVSFKGRVSRDDWVSQAAKLVKK